MRWMSHVRGVEGGLCDSSDREDAAPARELVRERETGLDLGSCRRAIPCGGSGVRRDDVPEKDFLIEAELGEDAVHNRRRRLARCVAGELTLGGERDPGYACAAVAGGLTEEQDGCVRAGLEVALEALREAVVAILVERVADSRRGESVYQRSQ